MAAKIGSLNIQLNMSTADITSAATIAEQQLNRVGTAAERTQMRLDKSAAGRAGGSAGGGKGSGNLQFAISNLAYGFDDFSQQLQFGGIQQAIRAAGNNVTAVTAAFGPLALVAGALGVTLVSMIDGTT